MPVEFLDEVYSDIANDAIAPASETLLPSGLANSLLILGFGACVMWACSILWRFKMISALSKAFSQGQIIRIDSAGQFLSTTDTAVRVSNVQTLIRESPRSPERRTQTRIEQIYSPINVRADSVRCLTNEIVMPITNDVPVTVIVIPVSIDSILASLSSFNDLKMLQRRPDKMIAQYPAGISSIQLDVDTATRSVVILMIESVSSTAHLLGIQERIVRRHVFVAGSTVVDVSEVFGQDSDDDCVVCLSNNKSVVLLPCLHMCICAFCNRQIDRCPVCRSPIERFLSDQPGPVEDQDQPVPDNHIIGLVSSQSY